MGHTVSTQRRELYKLIKEMHAYGKALREEDREIYNEIIQQAYKHIGPLSYTSSIHVWAVALLSMLLEQEKKIRQLEDEIIGRIQEEELPGIMAER